MRRGLPAVSGVRWFRGAIDLVRRNPLPLLGATVALMVTSVVLSSIPLLGPTAGALSGPLLCAGLVHASRRSETGTPMIP